MDSKIEDVILLSNINKERIFPILNKIDRIWAKSPNLQFYELVNLLTKNNLSDNEFTKELDNYINENGIK